MHISGWGPCRNFYWRALYVYYWIGIEQWGLLINSDRCTIYAWFRTVHCGLINYDSPFESSLLFASCRKVGRGWEFIEPLIEHQVDQIIQISVGYRGHVPCGLPHSSEGTQYAFLLPIHVCLAFLSLSFIHWVGTVYIHVLVVCTCTHAINFPGHLTPLFIFASIYQEASTFSVPA